MKSILLASLIGLAAAMIAPATAHVPFQCSPYSKAVHEQLLKKFEMKQELIMTEMRLMIQGAKKEREEGKELSGYVDPADLLKSYEEYVDFDLDRVWPAWKRWLACLKNFEHLPDFR